MFHPLDRFIETSNLGVVAADIVCLTRVPGSRSGLITLGYEL